MRTSALDELSAQEPDVLNVLSFDLEHWHSATLLQKHVQDPADRVDESLDIVLDILDEYEVAATFFVVGELAEQYPEQVARVTDAGHEIATHGHTHTPLFELSPDEFERELIRSERAIEEATGRIPNGFRAPNFSVATETKWAFSKLLDRGYTYDSSVFPVRTPMYGVSGAPRAPYLVDNETPFSPSAPIVGESKLVELPLAAFGTWPKVPIAGGFYVRVLPTWLVGRGIDWLNSRGIPATIYFHPWEFNENVVSSGIPYHKRFVSFHNVDSTRGKLEALLERFPFGSVRAFLERDDAPKSSPTSLAGASLRRSG